MREHVTVYFDYLCPFSWRAAEVAESVAEPLQLDFEWRHFSLYQANHKTNDFWQLWNQKIDPEDGSGGLGLLPFLASQAARRQGKARSDAFRLALLRARHRGHQAMSRATILDVAEQVGLHLPQFTSDLANPESRTILAQEHYGGAARDVFGSPTFAFDNGDLAYFRLRDLPRGPDEALRLFCDYRHLLEAYPYLEMVRRPSAKGN